MKITDYATRTSPMDYYIAQKCAALPSMTFLTGIEVGVDVGAHAHSMLDNLPINKLYLVDIWDKDFYRGYCQGRLDTHGYMSMFEMIKSDSIEASKKFGYGEFDFIYIDQRHEYESVMNDLKAWWPKLKKDGIMGYRNYAESNAGLKKAVDEFLEQTPHSDHKVIQGEIVIFK